MSDDFYLTLPSNSSVGYYPNNTTANFVTQLPNRITLHGSWEVALHEIHYPHTFFNITEGENMIRSRILGIAKDEEDILGEVMIAPDFYPDVSTVFEGVNAMFKDEVSFNRDKDNRTVITVAPRYKDRMIILMSDRLALQLGFDPHTDLGKLTHSPRRIDMAIGTPQQMLVYCDVVENQTVGDTLAPLLRTIGTRAESLKYGDTVSKTFHLPLYLPVLKREFTTLEIHLTGATGASAPFTAGTSIVLLHFRRRRES